MRLGWGARQLIALVLLALVLVCVTGFLELMSAIRLGTRQAEIEAELVAGGVRRELTWLTTRFPDMDLSEISRSAGLRKVIDDAIVLAPSVISVAVLAPDGTYVAHNDSTRIGLPAVSLPSLPDVSGTADAVRALLALRESAPDYQSEVALLRGEKRFADVQVVISGTFLWHSVEEAMSRGAVTAAIVVGLALLAGIVLSRLLTGRVRALEAGARALSEGRLDVHLPESRGDEFAGLAQALNALGDRFRETAAHPRPAGTAPIDLSPVLDRLGRMASGVAHELRNHLQRAELELTLAQRESGEERARAVDRARESVRQVEEVVRGYLRVSSMGTIDPRPTDIDALLAGVRDELSAQARMAGVEILVETDGSLGELPVDAPVLKQALHNGIRNAIQAMGEHGAGRIVLSASRGDATLQIGITDDGPGMDDETRRRAFEPYFTTRRGGSGVGLALVAQAIELHGGRARLESEISRGTTLTLELPCPRAD